MSEEGRKTGFRGNAENAKTRLCTRWKNGHCRFGDRCNFAHGEHELRKLPVRGGRGGQAGRGPARPSPGRGQQMPEKVHEGSQPIAARSPATSIHKMGPGNAGGAMAAAHASPDSHASSNAAGIISHLGGQLPDNVWAACGFPLAGANGWVMYRVQETGEPYYHHAERNITQWDQPADFIEH